jgi:hypothetical protein
MEYKIGAGPRVRACFCVGPQNGEPYCPCRMRELRVYKKDGRWVEPEKDLGPDLSVFGGKDA